MRSETPRRRIALGLEYHGGGYAGWQAQHDPRLPTIQAALERALGRVAARPVTTVCAGRTDAGVHAGAQVVHFDTDAQRPLRAWVLGTNAWLPRDISVQWARVVPDDFHARFSAEYRRYRYLILSRPQRPALLAGAVCHERRTLDEGQMHTAAQALLGERDFSAFRAAGCQSRTPMRRVERIAVERHGELIVIDIRANAFLLHMVRNIAGSLLAIGRGERAPGWMEELLAGGDRTRAGVTAPAQGLYLVEVGYAARWGLPVPGSGTIPGVLSALTGFC